MPRQSHKRNRENRQLKQTAAGRVLLKAIIDINDLRNELQRRVMDQDVWAAEKVSIANVALDRLEAIRNAMLEDLSH